MPRFFGDSARRLTRSKWAGEDGAQRLSEELHAMFTDDSPLTTDVPITITQSGDTPGITIVNNNGDTIFNSNNGTGGSGGTSGGTSGTPSSSDDAVSGCLLGTVVSGAGATYTVNLGGGRIVTVTQGQINSSDVIPAGTAALVGFAGPLASRSYFMQVPVWL